MSHQNRYLLVALAAWAVCVSPKASECYLLLKDAKGDLIKGESLATRLEDSIQLESFTLEVANPPAADGSPTKPVFGDLRLTKPLDRSSPLLYLNCAQGTHLASATLVVRQRTANAPAGFVDYYKITLTDVTVTSVGTAGHNSVSEPPSEVLALHFAKIEFSYQVIKQDGSLDKPVTSSWDLAKGTP